MTTPPITRGLLSPMKCNGSHDRAAAARKGKAASPWRRGCPWLSGTGSTERRIGIARKREMIERERFPGAHKRPAIVMDNTQIQRRR